MTVDTRRSKPQVVVSTCGISLITNRAGKDLSELLKRTANAKDTDLTGPERAAIEQRLKECIFGHFDNGRFVLDRLGDHL